MAAAPPGPPPREQADGPSGRRERAGRARRHDRALGVDGVRAGREHPGRRDRAPPVVRVRPASADGDRGRADRQAGGAGPRRRRRRRHLRPDPRRRGPQPREHGAAAGRRHPRRGAVLRPRLRRRPRARRPGALPLPPRGRHDHPRRGVHHRSRPDRVGAVHVHRVRRPGREREPTRQTVRQLLQARRHPPRRRALGRTGRAGRGAAARVPPARGRHLLRRPRRLRPPGQEQRRRERRQRLRQLRPDRLVAVLRRDREERGDHALAVRHGQPRHGGALRRQPRARRRDARVRGPRRPARPAAHRPGGLPVGVLRGLRQRRRAQPRRQRPVRRDPHQRRLQPAAHS